MRFAVTLERREMRKPTPWLKPHIDMWRRQHMRAEAAEYANQFEMVWRRIHFKLRWGAGQK